MSVGDAAHNSLFFNRGQLPLFLAGVLFVPTLDTIRVMLLRFTRGVSMFKPDRNHIHHLVNSKVKSHFKTLIIILMSYLVILFVLQFIT